MDTQRPVRRLRDVSRFHEDHFLRGTEPVVFEGAARAMGALERWTDAYLISALGEARPLVRLPDGQRAAMRIADFLEYMERPDRFTSKVGAAYLTDFYVKPTFGDAARSRLALDAICPLPRSESLAEWISVYAGPAGTTTACHQDAFGTHTWFAAIRGRKRWRLCAPDALAPGTFEPKLFAGAPGVDDILETVLEPGDVIYLPPGWWHEVVNESATLGISGNVCTWSQARRALRDAETSKDARHRRVWVDTWTAVLELEPHALTG